MYICAVRNTLISVFFLYLPVCTSECFCPVLPPPLSTLGTTHLFSVSLSLFLFCYSHSFKKLLRFHTEMKTCGIFLCLTDFPERSTVPDSHPPVLLHVAKSHSFPGSYSIACVHICVCVPHLPYAFICWGNLSFFRSLATVRLFVFGCSGRPLLLAGSLSLRRAGAALSLWRVGFSLQWPLFLWSTGPRARGLQYWRHVESSWTRTRTCVPSIGRQSLIRCTVREVIGFRQ